MSSINAKNVAREVLETIGKGEKPSVLQIAPKYGYSKKTAGSGQIQQTKSYKEELSPVISKMILERDRLIEALGKKNLSKEKYRDIVDGFDKLTKNIQLLNGGATERQGISITFDTSFNK